MTHFFQRQGLSGIGLTLVFFLAPTAAMAQSRTNDASHQAAAAARVITEIMGTPDKSIPKDLLDKSEAVAVFPGVKKAAFIIGGRGGRGVISRRTSSGWSAPAFYNLGGGSFGPQIGAESTDYVLLIMNDNGLNGLMSDKFEVGAGVEAAAGPVGREASAATDIKLKAGILTYSRNKGAFIGASLKGTRISPDNDLNQAFYGMKAAEVLGGGVKPTPRPVEVFPRTLAQY